MKSKYWVAGIFAVAILVAGIAIAFDTGYLGNTSPSNQGAANQEVAPDSGQESAKAEPTAESSATSFPSGAPGDSAGEQGEWPSSTTPTQSTRPVYIPTEPESTEGLEVPASGTPIPPSLPTSVGRRPALTDIPPTGSAKGKLTKGFPKKAVPLPAKIDVESSSVHRQGQLVLVSVEAQSQQEKQAVIDFYVEQIKKMGWIPTTTVVDANSTVVRGAFEGDSLSVTLRSRPTGSLVLSVAGAFRVAE